VTDPTPLYFASPDEMAAWLEDHHATASEVWIGLYKKGSARSGITLREAQDQGLRYGWIDSLARRVDDDSWMLRFTPRRPNSNWVQGNVDRAEELIAQGLMHEAGLRAFESRRR
jgi:uncharacterized protein YdeI (YjbR/CyaY-like superfamily)